MLGKFGLVLLVLLFGACMFVAGVMAPPSLRQPIDALAGHLPDARDTATAAARRPGAPAASASSAPASGTPASATPAAAGTAAPVRLDSLVVGAHVARPAPAKGQPAYALQLGQFVRDADADAMAARAAKAMPDLPLSRIASVDASGHDWTVVAIGRYVSPDDSQRDAALLRASLDLGDLPVIRLPEPPPSAKPGA